MQAPPRPRARESTDACSCLAVYAGGRRAPELAQRTPAALQRTPVSLQQCPVQYHPRNAEIDHEPSDVDERGDERSRRGCRIESEPPQDERKHRPGERPEGDD